MHARRDHDVARTYVDGSLGTALIYCVTHSQKVSEYKQTVQYTDKGMHACLHVGARTASSLVLRRKNNQANTMYIYIYEYTFAHRGITYSHLSRTSRSWIVISDQCRLVYLL